MAAPRAASYTPLQVDAYLKHISFPAQRYARITSEAAKTEVGLEYLSVLQRYQLAAIPFENLVLHYSKGRVISIDEDDLYQKIVENGKGGYCMENNQFFGTMLKSLGFEVVTTGARVYGPDGAFGGWAHQVNLVIIAGTIYLVDVGFGGSCPTRPMPLTDNHISNWGATEASNRLIYQAPSHPIVQGLWTLQHRISEKHDWTPLYVFGMTEFFPRDFEVMNFATSARNTSFFTYRVICAKMVIDEEVDDIVGLLALEGGRLKRRIGAVTEDLIECRNEEERVGALKEHFGIDLGKSEIDGIKRTVTELTGEN